MEISATIIITDKLIEGFTADRLSVEGTSKNLAFELLLLDKLNDVNSIWSDTVQCLIIDKIDYFKNDLIFRFDNNKMVGCNLIKEGNIKDFQILTLKDQKTISPSMVELLDNYIKKLKN
jgi:hypothetical protein